MPINNPFGVFNSPTSPSGRITFTRPKRTVTAPPKSAAPKSGPVRRQTVPGISFRAANPYSQLGLFDPTKPTTAPLTRENLEATYTQVVVWARARGFDPDRKAPPTFDDLIKSMGRKPVAGDNYSQVLFTYTLYPYLGENGIIVWTALRATSPTWTSHPVSYKDQTVAARDGAINFARQIQGGAGANPGTLPALISKFNVLNYFAPILGVAPVEALPADVLALAGQPFFTPPSTGSGQGPEQPPLTPPVTSSSPSVDQNTLILAGVAAFAIAALGVGAWYVTKDA